MKTFLFPTDFSATAKHAVIYGYDVAQQIKANIVLCNAVDFFPVAPGAALSVLPAEVSGLMLKQSTDKLFQLKSYLEKTTHSAGFKPHISCINDEGTLKHVIDEIIENRNIDLVIIGAHSGGVSNTLLLGNQSRELIDVITKPLLLVPREARIAPIKKIAFATDFEHIKDDMDSVYVLISLARPLNAEILVTHIYNKKSQTAEFKQVIQTLMNKLSDETDYPHIFYRAFVNSSANSGLDWLCQHGEIDILSIVHRSHTFIDSVFRGNQTQKAVDRMSIPLLVFPTI